VFQTLGCVFVCRGQSEQQFVSRGAAFVARKVLLGCLFIEVRVKRTLPVLVFLAGQHRVFTYRLSMVNGQCKDCQLKRVKAQVGVVQFSEFSNDDILITA